MGEEDVHDRTPTESRSERRPPRRMAGLLRWALVLILALGVVPERAPGQAAQDAAEHVTDASSESIDRQLLRGVYATEAAPMRGTMHGADATAFPMFYGAPVAAWGGAWLVRGGDDWSDAYRLTVAQVATYGAINGLKALTQRSRPYWRVEGITSRSFRYSPDGPEGNSYAFPSGHAAMSFAIVTSWSLSHPEWYVWAPGAVWAAAVSVSRIWLGVHYPSDVLAGMVLGIGVSTAVHLLGDAIIPDAFRPETAGAATAPISLHIHW